MEAGCDSELIEGVLTMRMPLLLSMINTFIERVIFVSNKIKESGHSSKIFLSSFRF